MQEYILKLDDDRWDGFQMLAGSMVAPYDCRSGVICLWFSYLSPTSYTRIWWDLFFNPFLPFIGHFFYPAAVPKGLWTSRSTPALWVRCAASESQPTNLPGVLTPAEKWLLGCLFSEWWSQRTLNMLLLYGLVGSLFIQAARLPTLLRFYPIVKFTGTQVWRTKNTPGVVTLGLYRLLTFFIIHSLLFILPMVELLIVWIVHHLPIRANLSPTWTHVVHSLRGYGNVLLRPDGGPRWRCWITSINLSFWLPDL